MRIWDISSKNLCRKHLIAEHEELHSLWSIIINNKRGYSKHPETSRWRGNPAFSIGWLLLGVLTLLSTLQFWTCISVLHYFGFRADESHLKNLSGNVM